ncbi:MAG: hypothetical protein ACK4VI_03755 [Alphaproteobacteria bacterium]
MKPIYFFIFIFFVPALCSLLHDFYLFYLAQGQQLNPDLFTKLYTEDRPGRVFEFAAIGFIWLQYSPESYKGMSDSMTAQEWSEVQEYLKLSLTIILAQFGAILTAIAIGVKAAMHFKQTSKKVSRLKKARINRGEQ